MSIRRYPPIPIAGSVDVNVHDGNGLIIDSTKDLISGEQGLNVNLSSSYVMGQVGSTLDPLNPDAALSVAYNNGGTLQIPNMDVVDGTLIVDATQKGNVPVNVDQIGGSSVSLGTNVMASSLPVTLASDQPDLPTNLSQVGGAAIALGTNVMAGSVPVTIASDQSPVNTFQIGPVGQTLMAGSAPVVIASDQSTIPVLASGTVIADAGAGIFNVAAATLPLPVGASTDSTLMSGAQKTQISNAGGIPVDVRTIGTAIVSGDQSLITQAVIHGLSSGGGGSYVDCKVTPSGALVTDATISGAVTVAQPTAANLNATVVGTGTFAVQAAQSGTWNINNVSGTVSLPTGAATSAKQPALGTSGTASTDVITIQGIAGMTAVKVDGSAVTQPISAASLPLPSGAATSANQTTLGSQTTKINDGTNTAAVKAASTAPVASDPALVVSVSPNSSLNIKQTNTVGTFIRNDYTSASVTTSAYTQLIASTAAAYSAVEIFDSSGQTLKLAIGGAGSEVDQFLIFPGGNGRIPFTIASGSRVSVKAVSANATVGELDINFYV